LEENNAILKKIAWLSKVGAFYECIILAHYTWLNFWRILFCATYLTDIGVSPDTIRTLIETPISFFEGN